MPSERQRDGAAAEDRAAAVLRSKGYEILGRHLTSRYGEIDILARDGETIVAVEVKARRNATYGQAVESMTTAKLNRIAAVLHETLEKRGWATRPYRIDLVTIEPNRVEHHRSVG